MGSSNEAQLDATGSSGAARHGCANRVGFGITHLFEVGDKPRTRRLPAELFPGNRARGRNAIGGKHAHPSEVSRGLFRGDRHSRKFQAPADGFGNIPYSATA
jgi:hypothetical protein